jgi:hypothetical protein
VTAPDPGHEDLRTARARYFRENGFPPGGGYEAKWVRLKVGPLPLGFPNTDARRRAVRFHDLHHVVTGYATDWTGEAEIGAWEVASGCADHYAAWLLNLSAMAIGLLVGPRRTFRAFVRGRRTGNLYRETWRAALLDERVGAVRDRLCLGGGSGEARAGDVLAFAGWSVAAVGSLALQTVLFVGPPALAVWLVLRLVSA